MHLAARAGVQLVNDVTATKQIPLHTFWHGNVRDFSQVNFIF